MRSIRPGLGELLGLALQPIGLGTVEEVRDHRCQAPDLGEPLDLDRRLQPTRT